METWIKTIASYMVFSAFFLQLLPSPKYEKYIRVFVGMLFLLVIISPIMEFFSVNQSFWGHFEENLLMVQGTLDGNEVLEVFAYREIAEAYETQLEEIYLQYVYDQKVSGIKEIQVVCDCSFGSLTYGEPIKIIFVQQQEGITAISPIVIEKDMQMTQVNIPQQYVEFLTDFKNKFSLDDTVRISFE